MIGEGKFQVELTRACALLEKFKLAAYQNPQPARDRATIARIRAAETYREEYNSYVVDQAYDLLLDDGSLLFFRRDPEASTQLVLRILGVAV